jgi:glycosyltransferase involved in cell wall biosynthesis
VVNLNRGLELARGEFIARIDADDLHRPGKLAAQVAEMDASPSLVLLGTNFEYVDASGKVFKRESPETDRQLLKERLQADGNQFCHSSVMFRAEMARQIGGYRMLAGRYAQDYDLWLRLSERGEIGCLPGHLTAYRCHDEMLSLTRLAQQRRAAEIYKEIGRHRPLRHPIRRSLHPNTGCQLTVARLVENRCAALDRWALRRDPTYDWRSFKVYLKTQSFMSDMRREHTATACSNRLWPPPVSTSVAQGGRDRCA